jgi:hypothetical protein
VANQTELLSFPYLYFLGESLLFTSSFFAFLPFLLCACFAFFFVFFYLCPFDAFMEPSPQLFVIKKKSKAVPLHAMEAHGGRGGIAPTHS